MNTREDVTAAKILPDWEATVENRVAPTLYRVGEGGMEKVEAGPGLVMMIGGLPSVGKSALVTQMAFDALLLNTDLRVAMCSVEMTPFQLFDRQLCRLASIPMSDVRYRRFTSEDDERLSHARKVLRGLGERLLFIRSHFNIDHVASAADQFDAQMIIVDYVQRVVPASYTDLRVGMNNTLSIIRQVADLGRAVIAVSALARHDPAEPPSLSHFRESSECEYAIDAAYMLRRDKNDPTSVTLHDLKARHGVPRDVRLRFDSSYQSFTAA